MAAEKGKVGKTQKYCVFGLQISWESQVRLNGSSVIWKQRGSKGSRLQSQAIGPMAPGAKGGKQFGSQNINKVASGGCNLVPDYLLGMQNLQHLQLPT